MSICDHPWKLWGGREAKPWKDPPVLISSAVTVSVHLVTQKARWFTGRESMQVARADEDVQGAD